LIAEYEDKAKTIESERHSLELTGNSMYCFCVTLVTRVEKGITKQYEALII
jgi:hypothetical protein